MGFSIMQRDADLMSLMYEQRFLSRAHLLEGPFFGVHPTAANRRMRRLKDAGLVKVERRHLLLGQDLFRLTELGLSFARSRAALPVYYRLPGCYESIVHDSLVTSLRLRLEREIPASFWRPETTFDDALRPDGILYASRDCGIAFEVERSRKATHRYVELLSRWSDTPSIRWLVYLATSPDIEIYLEGVLRRYRSPIGIGLARYGDFMNDFHVRVEGGQRLDIRVTLRGLEAA